MRRAIHIVVKGRVQGVGFRNFTVANASALTLTGWVRNRRDGSVEAVIAGPTDRVDRLLLALRVGPPAARVDDLTIRPYEGEVGGTFEAVATL